LRDIEINLWKLNLLAIYVSQEKEILFVAENSQVLVYPISLSDCQSDTDPKCFSQPTQRLKLNNNEMEINQIRLDTLNSNIPILITVDEGGEVRIFFCGRFGKKTYLFK